MARTFHPLLFALALVAVACGSGETALSAADVIPAGEIPFDDDGDVLRGTWEMTEFNGELVDPETNVSQTPQLEVSADEISGNSGCNGFGSYYEFDGVTITFDGGSITEEGCERPDGQGEVIPTETLLLSALRSGADVQLSDDGAQMTWTTGADSLVWVRVVSAVSGPVEAVSNQPDPGFVIEGIWQMVEFGEEAVDVNINTANIPQLQFADGAVVGNFGCNNGGGDYELISGSIMFSNIEAEEAGCPRPDGRDGLVPTETLLLALFNSGQPVPIEVDGGFMTWSQDDVLLAFELVDG